MTDDKLDYLPRHQATFILSYYELIYVQLYRRQ